MATSNEDHIAFKQAVKQACLAVLEQRIANAQAAMQNAQDSANNQEKSSAGDKYETSRAMGQIDRDMNARQLQEAQKDHQFLTGINTSVINNTIAIGSVIELPATTFFIAIGLGAVNVGNKTVMVISYKSPLYEQLKNKKTGEKVMFGGKEQEITRII